MSSTAIIIICVTNILWGLAVIKLNDYWAKQVQDACEMAKRQSNEWYEFCKKQRRDFVEIINIYRERLNEK